MKTLWAALGKSALTKKSKHSLQSFHRRASRAFTSKIHFSSMKHVFVKNWKSTSWTLTFRFRICRANLSRSLKNVSLLSQLVFTLDPRAWEKRRWLLPISRCFPTRLKRQWSVFARFGHLWCSPRFAKECKPKRRVGDQPTLYQPSQGWEACSVARGLKRWSVNKVEWRG